MPDLTLSCTINTRGLNEGIRVASQYTKRSLPKMVNTCAYWIAINAKNGMPFVPTEKIDYELSVIANPVIGKRGKPLKSKKRYSAGNMVGGPPLAALIIQARANPDSEYNRRTNLRYALLASPFKGKTRAAGAAAMSQMIHNMISGRHRSIKFLIAGWLPVIRQLKAHTQDAFAAPGSVSALSGAVTTYRENLGEAHPAREGLTVTAIIANLVGMEGKNGPSFNRALIGYGAGPLQDAVDREGRRQMDYALGKMGVDLKAVVKPHWE